MSRLAYHPGTGANVVVTDDQLAHMRASGWMLMSEHEQNQVADAERAEQAAAAAEKAKPAAQPAVKKES